MLALRQLLGAYCKIELIVGAGIGGTGGSAKPILSQQTIGCKPMACGCDWKSPVPAEAGQMTAAQAA